MAVHRNPPKCYSCGEVIAKAIHSNADKSFVGDTFIRWEYLEHKCHGQREIKRNPASDEFLKEFFNEIK